MSALTEAFAALIEALPEPVLLVRQDRRIEAANAPARELFGASVVGMPVLSCMRQPAAVQALESGFNALADPARPQGPFTAEQMFPLPVGERTFRVHVAPLTKPSPAEGRLVVSLSDISALEAAEQQRRDFVANVSHEMRSPLTALLGFIETLRGPARDDPEAQVQFLDIMEQEAQRMARLVADLLSLSKVEANEKVRPRDSVSLQEVLRATIAALRPQIETAGILVSLDDRAASDPIPGDRDQLVQVFHNLVENALKYGASGGRVEITVERLEQVAGFDDPVMRVTVTDYGEGIDPIHIPRLTERFYRVDSHRSRAMGGTGLGLAIVKHIVARHRGRLIIRSVRGQGSSFSVLLPCR